MSDKIETLIMLDGRVYVQTIELLVNEADASNADMQSELQLAREQLAASSTLDEKTIRLLSEAKALYNEQEAEIERLKEALSQAVKQINREHRKTENAEHAEPDLTGPPPKK